MKLKRIRGWNYLCYQKFDLPLDKEGTTFISGPTGSGKSSIFSAITICLFDKDDKGRNLSELPNWYSPNEETKLILDVEDSTGTHYSIKKLFTKTGNKTSIKGGETTEAQKHWRSTEHKAKIRQIVGMDYETFISSIYLRQGQITKLITGTSTERNAIFSKFQDIPILEEARKIQQQEYAEDKESLEDLESKIRGIKTRIAELGLKDAEILHGRIKISLAQRREEEDSIKKEIQLLQGKIRRLEEEDKEFTTNSFEKETLEHDLLDIKRRSSKFGTEYAGLDGKIQSLTAQVSELSASVIDIKSKLEAGIAEQESIPIIEESMALQQTQIEELMSSIKKTDSELAVITERSFQAEETIISLASVETCPECYQLVTEDHKSKVKLKLEKRKAKYARQFEQLDNERKKQRIHLSVLKDTYEKDGYRLNNLRSNHSLNKLESDLEKLENRRDYIDQQVEDAEARKAEIKENHEALQALYKEKKIRLSSVMQKLEELVGTNNDNVLHTLRNNHYRKLEDWQQITSLISKLEKDQLDAESVIGKCRKLNDRSKSLEFIKRETEKKLLYHDIYAEVLSKNGLRVHKIESMLQQINGYISSYQSHFTDTKIVNTEFIIDEKGKIDLYVWIKGIPEPRSVRVLSGGETEMVSLPVILAVFTYIGNRGFCNNLFIDEALVHLDDERKSYVSDVLKDIKEKGINIFVVSHDSYIKDFDYDHFWNVIPRDDHSIVELA